MAVERFSRSGPRLEAQDIEKAEELFSARLPRAYKTFLLTTNGGKPKPRYFQDMPVQAFYSLYPRGRSFNLLESYQTLRERLPKGVIPIGCGPFGDQFCLALKGKYRGKVFFWDHEGPTADDLPEEDLWIEFSEALGFGKQEPPVYDWPGHPDMSLLADSFTEFLDGFHDSTEAELASQSNGLDGEDD